MRLVVTSSSVPVLIVQLVLAAAFVQIVTCAMLPDIRRMIFGFFRGAGGGKVVV